MGCFHSKETEQAAGRRSPDGVVIAPAVQTVEPLPSPPDNQPQDNNNNTTNNSDNNTNPDTTNNDDSTDKNTPPAPPAMKCRICYDEIPEPLQATISRPCKNHRSPTCDDCIRKMFLNACKDETQMPPTCCNPIPASYGRRVLSVDEMALFQAKYEEWSTRDRLYCPVPTCSAFISPRLFPKKKKKQQQQAVSPAGVQTPPPTPPDEEVSTTVSCPQCSVRVCISCKQLSHPGDPCPEGSDIPPELEALLKTWGIKRCPRCHAAVRRMYGCKHIRCRCGAQWCWWCTGPIQICQSQPCPAENEGEMEEEDMNDEADEYFQGMNNEQSEDTDAPQQDTNRIVNLDAGRNWELLNLDLGGEPDAEEIHPFTCEHIWDESYGALHDDVDEDQGEECALCWRPLILRPEEYAYIGLEVFLDTGTIKEIPIEEFPRTEKFANLCGRCGIVLCPECRELSQPQQ